MKIRCLLIDDEPPALKVLASHISHINWLEIVAQCRSAIEALDVLHQKDIDLIFLDIKMPKLLGTDFLRNLSHPPKVIFVTAYRDYALEGYDLEAVDYLVKPVSFERFLKAVTKAKRLTGNGISIEPIDSFVQSEAFLYLKVDKEMKKVILDEIVYIESWKDYIKVILTDGKSLLVKQSISSIQNMLSDHKFLRVHRSYIVSIKKISGYNGVSVKIHSTKIPIGRLYKQSVMEAIQPN